jgi:hypothetical protein
MENVYGPVNLVYLTRERDGKKVYIFYDIHNIEDLHPNSDNFPKTTDLINQLSKQIDQFDLFVETPILFKEKEADPDEMTSSLYEMRLLLNLENCPKNTKCHSVDNRDHFLNIVSIIRLNQHFYKCKDALNSAPVSVSQPIFNSIIDLYKSILNSFYSKTIGIKNIKGKLSKLIGDLLFIQQYKKLHLLDKKPYRQLHIHVKKLIDNYVEINRALLTKLSQNFKSDIYTNSLNQKRDLFMKNNTLPEMFNSFDESTDFLISVSAKLLNVYTIGRILKPGINNIIIYVGADHAKDITKQLTSKFDFNLIHQHDDISYPKWKNIMTTVPIINISKFKPFWS